MTLHHEDVHLGECNNKQLFFKKILASDDKV